jgi:hypothetical protein
MVFQGTTLSATVFASVPGTYKIVAVTSYTSSNPSAPPPPPKTTSGTFSIAPPSGIPPVAGMGLGTSLGSTVLIQSQVTAGQGQIGPYVAATIQENIPIFYFTNGMTEPGTGGWYPGPAGPSGSPSVQFYLTNGILNDVVGIGGTTGNAAFFATAIGSPVCTYTQQLQYTYQISDASGNHAVVVPLPSLNFTITRATAFSFSVSVK